MVITNGEDIQFLPSYSNKCRRDQMSTYSNVMLKRRKSMFILIGIITCAVIVVYMTRENQRIVLSVSSRKGCKNGECHDVHNLLSERDPSFERESRSVHLRPIPQDTNGSSIESRMNRTDPRTYSMANDTAEITSLTPGNNKSDDLRPIQAVRNVTTTTLHETEGSSKVFPDKGTTDNSRPILEVADTIDMDRGRDSSVPLLNSVANETGSRVNSPDELNAMAHLSPIPVVAQFASIETGSNQTSSVHNSNAHKTEESFLPSPGNGSVPRTSVAPEVENKTNNILSLLIPISSIDELGEDSKPTKLGSTTGKHDEITSPGNNETKGITSIISKVQSVPIGQNPVVQSGIGNSPGNYNDSSILDLDVRTSEAFNFSFQDSTSINASLLSQDAASLRLNEGTSHSTLMPVPRNKTAMATDGNGTPAGAPGLTTSKYAAASPNQTASQSPKIIEDIAAASNPQTKTTREVKTDSTPLDIASMKLNQKTLQYLVFNTTLSDHDKAELFPYADVRDRKVNAIYSQDALNRLEKLQEKISRGTNITLVMNGGSSSAYIPGGQQSDLFYRHFVHTYLEAEWNAKVNIVDRAHGARNSAHSAHLISSFFPADVDIVIWEFSINDGVAAEDVRNAFILWLRNVAAHQASPPLVILVYLWKSPFQVDEHDQVLCRTFDQHEMIGSEYDFVLGHINMAAYLDSLEWKFPLLKEAFLADVHHPNTLFHHIVAKLLWQLISKASEDYTAVRSTVPAEKTDLSWICGDDLIEKRDLRKLFFETRGIAKGSYTVDLPKNEDNSNSLMVLPSNFSSLRRVSFGKGYDNRSDRQHGLVVPCCNSSSSMDFDVFRFGRIDSVMMSLRCTEETRNGLRILFDGIMLESQPTLMRPWKWHCLMGGYNMNVGDLPSLDVDFFMVNKHLASIGFCDSHCKRERPIPLVYLSLF